jgi:type IV secretion system protein VirD4
MMAAGNEALATLASSFVRTEGAGKNELSGIQSTYAQQSSWILSAPMRADLCKNGVDLRQLNSGPRPLVVFVVMRASQISAKRRYSRMLVTGALQGHMKPGKRSTLFVLDEFRASVGSMPIINDVWSLVRGYGCQLMPIVQSALQLKALFKDEWENYVAQAGLVATLGPANDDFTADWMSKRSGVTTILQAGFNLGDGINSGDGMSTGTGMSGGGGSSNQGNSSNKGRSRNGGLSYQQTEQRVLLPQEIKDIRAGHGLMWLPGMGVSTIPFFAPNFWQRNEEWVARVRRNPFHSG